MSGSRLLQGGAAGESSSVLRMLTDPNRSYSFRYPLQMQRFLGAALTYCKAYPNDVAHVLRCLGSQDMAGLQRLQEICSFPHTVDVCSGLLSTATIDWCFNCY